MKRLSDYKNEDAIELWADLIEPLSVILGDEEIRTTIQSGEPKLKIAKIILKNHAKEANEIMLRIDPEPIDGLNILLRLVGLLADIGSNEDIKAFFGFAEQEKMARESSGSPTGNTKAKKA